MTSLPKICEIEACLNRSYRRAGGPCKKHVDNPHAKAGRGSAVRTCSIDGCSAIHYARGWCSIHYLHWDRHGHPLSGDFRPKTEWERFWRHVKKGQDGDCWQWTASKFPNGYGQFHPAGGTTSPAHRVGYQMFHGVALRRDQQVDHLCHNITCVNPGHLRVVTNKQNHENLSGPTIANGTGSLGVSWSPSRRMYVASVTHAGRQWQRRYATLEEASLAVREKRIELFTHNDLDRTSCHTALE